MNISGEVKIRPVILAGGSGKRLWPISSGNCPKQFAKLVNEDSLFLLTLKRINDRTRYAAPYIIGNIEHIFFITAALERLGIKDATVMLEPTGRNTAAPAILAAIHEKEENMLHLLMPADQSIKNEEAFHESIAKSTGVMDISIVLLGIRPKYPETGYGYIVPGKPINGSGLQEISIFSEKPNETFARVLINQGALWNSGIFIYAPAVLREEARLLASKQYEQYEAVLKHAAFDRKCITFREQDYAVLESHSFDSLIVERTNRGAVLYSSMEWNDTSSWYSLWHMAEKDDNGNAIVGSVTTENVTNSYIHSESMEVAAIGLQDCMIIAANNRVLVAPCVHAQDVKELYEIYNLGDPNASNVRPWGMYKKIGSGQNYLVKQITVWPGCSISLQTHNHRAEHWVVVSGIAHTVCDGVEKIISENESVFVPIGAKHRLSNRGDSNLHIIEVQSGNYIGEDDIMRYEDTYGRV